MMNRNPKQASALLSFHKLDAQTGAGLSGAVFALRAPGGAVFTSVSGAQGQVQFEIAPCVSYTLSETAPPAGYAPIGASFEVAMDGCGRLFVNGECAEHLVLTNERLGAEIPLYPYLIRYYAIEIAPGNLLGEAIGAGKLGGYIDADLTLFAPPGFETPGTRSGATYIASDPAFNVVNVVYAPLYFSVRFEPNGGAPVPANQNVPYGGRIAQPAAPARSGYTFAGWYEAPDFSGDAWDFYSDTVSADMVLYAKWLQSTLGFYVEYYAYDLTPANLLGRVKMPGVPYATVITLTPAQLDLYRPSGFQGGVQVGGAAAITVDGQVIRVLYEPLIVRTVSANHFLEGAYGSGSFSLFQTTQINATDGTVLVGSSLAENLGANYAFSYSTPAQLTVSSTDNTINLYYARLAS